MWLLLSVVLPVVVKCFAPTEKIRNQLTDSERGSILNAHNDLRSAVAKGELVAGGHKLPTAADMKKMKWDSRLETSALKWSSQCKFAHSGYSGENVYQKFTYHQVSVEGIGERAADLWSSELLKTALASLKYDNRSRIKHASQMIWSKTEYIGCAASLCDEKNSRLILVCHYNPIGNIPNRMIYESGRTCSRCVDGCDVTSGLCDDNPYIIDGEVDSWELPNEVSEEVDVGGKSGEDILRSRAQGNQSGELLVVDGETRVPPKLARKLPSDEDSVEQTESPIEGEWRKTRLITIDYEKSTKKPLDEDGTFRRKRGNVDVQEQIPIRKSDESVEERTTAAPSYSIRNNLYRAIARNELADTSRIITTSNATSAGAVEKSEQSDASDSYLRMETGPGASLGAVHPVEVAEGRELHHLRSTSENPQVGEQRVNKLHFYSTTTDGRSRESDEKQLKQQPENISTAFPHYGRGRRGQYSLEEESYDDNLDSDEIKEIQDIYDAILN